MCIAEGLSCLQDEKEDMDKLQSTKEEIDRVNLEVQAAEREYDLNRAAELKYGTLLELQKQLQQAEDALQRQVCPYSAVPGFYGPSLLLSCTAASIQLICFHKGWDVTGSNWHSPLTGYHSCSHQQMTDSNAKD